MKPISPRSKRAVGPPDGLTETLRLIGKKLHELRIAQGYTSHELFAAVYNLPRVQYWRMERGKSNMTLRSLNRILAIHGLTIPEFFHLISSENGNSARGAKSFRQMHEASAQWTLKK